MVMCQEYRFCLCFWNEFWNYSVSGIFCFSFLLFPLAGEIKSLPWYMKIQWIFMNICGHAALQVTVGYWIMLANCKQIMKCKMVIENRGGSRGGGAPGARPPKIGKNMIFWRKIVIFHTKYPQIFRASLRSAQFF